MALHLERVDLRAKLKPRRDPYWQRLTQGRFVGFRRMVSGAQGTWLARFNTGVGYTYEPLGDFADHADKDRYDAAKGAAEEWFRHLDHGGSTDDLTVKSACVAYVDKLRTERSDDPADDAKARFARLVDDDPLGRVYLKKLGPRQLADWKKRVLTSQSRASFNRNATSLRAALNLAYQRRDVASDHAWKEELKPLKGTDGRRTLYLNLSERRRLINKAEEVQTFLKALALVPLRSGELAKHKVEHFDARQGVLRPDGKTGARMIPLAPDAVALFKAEAKGKPPEAWLVARANGQQWDRHEWKDQIKEAAKAAKLNDGTCATTIRHSVITDLVIGGLDLFTVAKLSGTSVAMIEKHYGQLQRKHAIKALKGLSL